MTATGAAGPQDVVRPAPPEVDVFGLTHPGRVRDGNADHFLVATLHRVVRVQRTSVDAGDLAPIESDARGYLLLIADGVGQSAGADDGSLHAIRTVSQHILHACELTAAAASPADDELVAELRESVVRAHEALRALRAAGAPATATTLTMAVVLWPRVYVVHAGDSRCYRLRERALARLTTDQTMAQAMVEAGAMSAEAAAASRLSHMLWSAVGSKEFAPEVLVADCDRRDVMLVCTDGLTRHVTEDEIRDHLARGASAEATCRALVELALERGGEDNVTVAVGRAGTQDQERAARV